LWCGGGPRHTDDEEGGSHEKAHSLPPLAVLPVHAEPPDDGDGGKRTVSEEGMIQPSEDIPVVKDGIGDVLGRTLLSARVVRVLPPPMLPPAVVAIMVSPYTHSSPQ
jgi:hypothetical protein